MDSVKCYFHDWKRSVEDFVFSVEKLAKPVLDSLDHIQSHPACITDQEVMQLKDKLERIRAAVSDADREEIDSESFKLWRSEIRDLECDAEDIFEEFEFEAQRNRLEEIKSELLQFHGKRKREIRRLLPPRPFSDLRSKIQYMYKRLGDIDHDRQALWLRNEDAGERQRPPIRTREESSSFFDDAEGGLRGRDEDMRRVVELALSTSDAADVRVYSVIPVVGLQGVGKTALVQRVFHIPEVAAHFENSRWWICFSKLDLDAVSITRSIIDAVLGRSDWEGRDCSQLNEHQKILRASLLGKMFLLVLDDVQTAIGKFWGSLQLPFSAGLRGSKVIITCRSWPIESITGGGSGPHHLRPLHDHHLKSFYGDHRQVEDVLGFIIPKCQGLPLAAKALQRLLDRRTDGEFCFTELWSELMVELLPDLRSSYDELPIHLKRCFEYLSLFPSDHGFHKVQLVRLWMAQGFEPPKVNVELGYSSGTARCFDKLVDMLLLEYKPDAKMYRTHGVFHELAQCVAEECSRSENMACSSSHLQVRSRTRHLSLVLRLGSEADMKQHREIKVEREPLSGDPARVRTLLLIGEGGDYSNLPFFQVHISAKTLEGLRCLRTLDLSNTALAELPFCLGALVHLRYLGLRNTKIAMLPESLCFLYKLQTLDLRDCPQLNMLPSGIKHLAQLLHLELPSNINFQVPSVMGELASLRTLTVGAGNSKYELSNIRELNNLVDLRVIYISSQSHVHSEMDAEQASLQSKERLKKLTLEWTKWSPSHAASCSNMEGTAAATSDGVLNRLRPYANLNELVIRGYNGTRFASWIGDESLGRLTRVTIQGCANCTELPSLGQLPTLRHLSVALMERVQRVGREFLGTRGFPLLETLEFEDMPVWEEWCDVVDGDFAKLRSLVIKKCSTLLNLPLFKPTVEVIIDDRRVQQSFEGEQLQSLLQHLNLNLSSIRQPSVPESMLF